MSDNQFGHIVVRKHIILSYLLPVRRDKTYVLLSECLEVEKKKYVR